MARRVWLSDFGLESFQQTVGKTGSIEDGAQQQKTSTRVFLARCFQKNFAHFRIAGESFRSLQQPYIELAFRSAEIRGELGVIVLRVVHQESGMHFKKLRQQRARGLSHMGARAALYLRDVG